MPTRLPRLNVTVSDEQHALLLRLGALQGRSAASYLRELLDASTPFLTALLPTLEAAQAGEERRSAEQAASVEALARSFMQGADADQLDLLEHIATVMLSEASAGGGNAGAERERAARDRVAVPPPVPPSSNTGVRSDQKGNKREGGPDDETRLRRITLYPNGVVFHGGPAVRAGRRNGRPSKREA